MEKIDAIATTFLSGPTEYLARNVCAEIAKVPQFKAIFGSNIDAYQRVDYSMRELPAVRVYNENWRKEFESWFIVGELLVDVIFPASLRRQQGQDFQDILTAALCQQFRRDDFFVALCSVNQGLNELGKTFDVDKSLGFNFGKGTDPVPLSQIRVNFRIDLRQWDLFLESDDRTKADPFERTLADLELITTTIANDSGSPIIGITQTV